MEQATNKIEWNLISAAYIKLAMYLKTKQKILKPSTQKYWPAP